MGDLERDDLLLLARTGENDRDDLLLPPRIGDNDRDDLLLIGDLERAGDLARTGVIEKTSTQTYEEQGVRFRPFSLCLKAMGMSYPRASLVRLQRLKLNEETARLLARNSIVFH